MINKHDDYYQFNKLISDAIDIIDSANPDKEVNKESILSAMKLNKLLLAEKRASESLSLLIDLSTTPEAISEALSSTSKNINNIDNLLAFNNEAYFRIISEVDRINNRS